MTEIIDNPVKTEIERLLNKLVAKMSDKKGLSDDHMGGVWLKGTLAINLIAFIDIGVLIYWDGFRISDHREILEQIKDECSGKVKVAWKSIDGWMNTWKSIDEWMNKRGPTQTDSKQCMFCGRPAKENGYIDGPQGSPLEPVCKVCIEKAERGGHLMDRRVVYDL